MSYVGVIFGTVALASVVVIFVLGFIKSTWLENDYNNKIKELIDQINASQYYEYQFNKSIAERVHKLESITQKT